MATLEYKPIPVKTLLKQMKDLSCLMVDLAFSSVIFGDSALAREVLDLEKEVDSTDILLTMQAALATRSVSAAEKMVSIFRIATATNMISDAAAEIAKIALSKISIPKEVALSLLESNEILARLEVDDKLAGRSIAKVLNELGVVIDVLVLRRGGKFKLEPQPSTRLARGDVIIVKGDKEALSALFNYLGLPFRRGKGPEVERYGNVFDMLVQMWNTSSVMVDIAFTALMAKSEELAEKVYELEEYVDAMFDRFELEFLEANKLSNKEKVGVLRIASASETIADAAASMVEPLLSGLEPHPLIADVLDETLERISVIEMDSEDEGKTLLELGYSKRGIEVLAVRRNGEWYVMPPYATFKVKSGDVLIVKYLSESEKIVDQLETEEDRREIVEEIQEEEWEEE